MSFYSDVKTLLDRGDLEIVTQVQNVTAIKSVIFLDGDVLSLANAQLLNADVADAHINLIRTKIGSALLAVNGLMKSVNYLASSLGLLIFGLNFSSEDLIRDNLILAASCLVGGTIFHLVLHILGRRLFKRIA